MDKFLLSSPALSHMELETSNVQRNLQSSLYDGSGLGVGFSPQSERKSNKSPDNSPPPSLSMSSFENSRNLSFINESQPLDQNIMANYNVPQTQQFYPLQDDNSLAEFRQAQSQSFQNQVSQQYHQLSNQFHQMQTAANGSSLANDGGSALVGGTNNPQFTHSRSHSHNLQSQKSHPSLKSNNIKTVKHSSSLNTISSTDSMPQLSSSNSNQSLLDSPASLYYNTMTPRKMGRKKSLSVSSANMYHTPMRGSSVPSSFSPSGTAAALAASNQLQVNSGTNGSATGNNKVGKTPHSSRGHSRSRSSRLSIDAINTPFLLNQAGPNSSTSINFNGNNGNNNNGNNTNNNSNNSMNNIGLNGNNSNNGAGLALNISANIPSYAIQNLSINGNPFYTPSSFESPKLDDLSGDLENLDTPLATPSGSFVNLQSHQQNFLSPAAKTWSATSGSTNTYPQYLASSTYQHNAPINPNEGYITPLALQRNDTLDSIKIEDQDDDALKEIRKAKHQIINSRSKNANLSIGGAGAIGGFEVDGLLFDASDFSTLKYNDNEIQNFQQQPQSDGNRSLGGNLISSHSTPGVLVSNNSPSQHSFGSSSQNLQRAYSSYSVPTTATGNLGGQNLPGDEIYNFGDASINGEDKLRGNATSNNSVGLDSIASVQSLYNNNNNNNASNLIANNNSNNNSSTIYNGNGSSQSSATLNSASSGNTFGGNHTPVSGPSATALLPPMATFSTANAAQKSKLQKPPKQKLNDGVVQNLKKVESKADAPIDPKKKHPCPICNSRFQRPEHVKRHLKSHSKEKPYECEEPDCGKRFNRKDNLKAHLKKIHQKV